MPPKRIQNFERKGTDGVARYHATVEVPIAVLKARVPPVLPESTRLIGIDVPLGDYFVEIPEKEKTITPTYQGDMTYRKEVGVCWGAYVKFHWVSKDGQNALMQLEIDTLDEGKWKANKDVFNAMAMALAPFGVGWNDCHAAGEENAILEGARYK